MALSIGEYDTKRKFSNMSKKEKAVKKITAILQLSQIEEDFKRLENKE